MLIINKKIGFMNFRSYSQIVPTLFGLPRELKPDPAILSVWSGELCPLPTRAAVIAPMNRTDWAVGEAGVPVQFQFSC